jgi:recombination protein RecR
MYPQSFKKLIDHFSSLPSIGPKMAERLVLYLFKQDKEKLIDFGTSLIELKSNLRYCEKCFNISEKRICNICQDKSRNKKIICVVEEPLDIIAIEKTRKYQGLYHVLGGTLGIIKNSQKQDLKLNELKKRILEEEIQEIILALNPTTEGDTTALYVTNFLKALPVKVTRLARGLSTGGDIEYTDEITLSSAIINRI